MRAHRVFAVLVVLVAFVGSESGAFSAESSTAGSGVMAPRGKEATQSATAPAAPAVPAALGQPAPLAVEALGSDGRGRIQSPGRSCDDGGAGAYWHHDHDATLAPGHFLSIPADLKFLLELHSDVITRPNSVDLPPPGPPDPGDPPTAFLPAGQSQAVLGNQRGTIRLGLASGTCTEPTVLFNGRTATGSGQWTMEGGTGSYASVTGSGTFAFDADVDPGADNPWAITLDGLLQVEQPHLVVAIDKVFWGNHGTDYLTRRVSVTYYVGNDGTGDAFDARLVSTSSPAAGVTPLGPHPQALGDIPAGEGKYVTVRYQLGLLQPCGLIILSCDFFTNLTIGWTDALDVPSQPISVPQPISAPDLPPVL